MEENRESRNMNPVFMMSDHLPSLFKQPVYISCSIVIISNDFYSENLISLNNKSHGYHIFDKYGT